MENAPKGVANKRKNVFSASLRGNKIAHQQSHFVRLMCTQDRQRRSPVTNHPLDKRLQGTRDSSVNS